MGNKVSVLLTGHSLTSEKSHSDLIKNLNSIVLCLDQTTRDIERFCTRLAPGNYFSPLAADDTYNIAEHYLVQTVYENLAVLRRDSLTSPWFPGPVSFVRNVAEDDHRILWQAAKRSRNSLLDLRVIGTDDDKAIYKAILGECGPLTHHILGLEHMKKNIKDKLLDLKFPTSQIKKILDDIFIDLYESTSEKDYEDKLVPIKEKWLEIENRFTRTDPPEQFVTYFENNKHNSIKHKMTKFIRERVNIRGDYWQNPVEWANHVI